MRQDKEEVFLLRRQGKSYREIQKELGMSRSTVSLWLKDVEWSKKIKNKLVIKHDIALVEKMKKMTKIAGEKRLQMYKNKREEALQSYELFCKDQLFISGLMVYWGEGDSKLENGKIRVANSNPLMIKLFYLFLKKYLPEIAIKAKIYLILYPDLNDEVCKVYWSSIVGIPLDNFFKSQYIKGHSVHRRLKYGVGNIIISSRAYKEVVHTWLEIKKEEIKLVRV